MKQLSLIYAILLAVFLIADSTSYAQEKGSQKIRTQATKLNEQKVGYSCPMHPEITSDKPGKCPKCGMALVMREDKQTATDQQRESKESSTNEKIQQAQSLLAEAKKQLAQDGKYNCCIKDPCDRCALDHQSCTCADDVKAGKAVCPDCYAGWQRGDGIVKGIKATKVKGSFHGHKH